MSCRRWPLAFILLTFITSLFPLVNSQYEAASCLNGNYSRGDFYSFNLNSLLASLPPNINNSGFISSSQGEARALALCRGDIQLDQCRRCVEAAANEILQACPERLRAIRWSEFCMLRISNEPMFWDPINSSYVASWSILNATSPQMFTEVLRSLIDDLRVEAAAGGSLRKAAAGNRTGPDFQTIFSMLQCTPDLSPENCTDCLIRAANQTMSTFRGPTPTVSMRVYTESCMIRYELYPFYNVTRFEEPLVPLPPPPLPRSPLPQPVPLPLAGDNKDNTTRNIIIITVSVVACLSLVVLCVIIFLRKRRQQNRKGIPEIGEDGDEISTVESIQYDFGKIRAATDDFSDVNKLGRGGFGAVYKGKLQNGREIAVKRLSWGSSQGDFEFKNEVLLVARLQHRNLVRLLGFSIQGIERLLIYEFVKNGSLDHVLFDPNKSSNLVWETRYKIIGGIARGLLYLHEDSRLRIIHRDLKASNVLLDEEMNPKISDFGMAKLVMPDATQESTSRIVGTYGYMAPEYAIHGHISVKSDIFTFGVLVLEIVSGQKKRFFRNGGSSGNHLLSYAWRSWREGTSANVIDPVLTSTSSHAQQDILRCIHIALLCVQENPDDRPAMASVVQMLNGFPPELPLPSEPGFYMPNTLSGASLPHEQNETESNTSSRSALARPADSSSSGNDSSITKLYPR